MGNIPGKRCFSLKQSHDTGGCCYTRVASGNVLDNTRSGVNLIYIPPRLPAFCPGGFIYTIMARDNIYLIASRYGTTVRAVLRVNPGLDPNRLYAGQRICIPVTPVPIPIPPPTERCPGGFFYTIIGGDTLYGVAVRFNTAVEAIIRANPGLDPNRMCTGQRICIPERRGPRATEYPGYMGYSENTFFPEGMY